MKKRILRRMRKNLMRLGKVKETPLNRGFNNELLPKNERGYSVEAHVNGYYICAPDDNPYDAYKGALMCAKWALEQDPHDKKTTYYHLSCPRCCKTWWSENAFPKYCPFCNNKRIFGIIHQDADKELNLE